MFALRPRRLKGDGGRVPLFRKYLTAILFLLSATLLASTPASAREAPARQNFDHFKTLIQNIY